MLTPTPFPWLPVIAIIGSLLGGGAMGAIINCLCLGTAVGDSL